MKEKEERKKELEGVRREGEKMPKTARGEGMRKLERERGGRDKAGKVGGEGELARAEKGER